MHDEGCEKPCARVFQSYTPICGREAIRGEPEEVEAWTLRPTLHGTEEGSKLVENPAFHRHSDDACFEKHVHTGKCRNGCQRTTDFACDIRNGSLIPACVTIDRILHEYFQINPMDVDREQRAILEWVRQLKA